MTHTPTTEQVRASYRPMLSRADGEAEFDRWLTENNRQVAEAAWEEGRVALIDDDATVLNNPHRTPQPTEGQSDE